MTPDQFEIFEILVLDKNQADYVYILRQRYQNPCQTEKIEFVHFLLYVFFMEVYINLIEKKSITINTFEKG